MEGDLGKSAGRKIIDGNRQTLVWGLKWFSCFNRFQVLVWTVFQCYSAEKGLFSGAFWQSMSDSQKSGSKTNLNESNMPLLDEETNEKENIEMKDSKEVSTHYGFHKFFTNPTTPSPSCSSNPDSEGRNRNFSLFCVVEISFCFITQPLLVSQPFDMNNSFELNIHVRLLV